MPPNNDTVQNGPDDVDNAANVKDEFLEELSILQEQIQNKNEKMKAAEKTAQNTRLTEAIFKIMTQILVPQVKDIKNSVSEMKKFQCEVSEQVSSLKVENELLKKRILDLEMTKCSKSLIIKNLKPKTKTGEAESQFNMKRNFDGILDRMNIKNQVKIDDIFRFKAKDDGLSLKKPMPVKVSFCSTFDKNSFLANLGKLKNTDYGNISAIIDVPKCLIPAYTQLDEMGYNSRKENLHSSYRIGFKGLGLALYVRLKDETKFKIMKEMT